MKSEREATRFMGLVSLLTFAASWFFGPASVLLSVGMGFASGYLGSEEEDLPDRVWQGFNGGLVGFMSGFIGFFAFVVVVKLVALATGVELRDVSFIESEW
jgi:hypothetical protein